MRWFIGILIVVNLAILGWGWLGDDDDPQAELAAPGVGTIRLLGEQPATPEPAAVPIPAPPRNTGEMAAREPAEAASVAPASQAEAPRAEPLTASDQAAEVAPDQAEQPMVAAAPAEVTQPVVSAPEPEYVPEPGVIAPVVARVCARVGPFADAAAAKAVRGYLEGLGQVSASQRPGEAHVGWWVLVPPQPSRAAAKAIAADLRAKGIKDYWVVSKGEAKNGISLGVFSQKDNAESLVKRLRAKGVKVELRDKTKPVDQLWLDYSGTKPITVAELGKRAPAGVRVESQDCPAAGERG